jgi:hypothetical protein
LAFILHHFNEHQIKKQWAPPVRFLLSDPCCQLNLNRQPGQDPDQTVGQFPPAQRFQSLDGTLLSQRQGGNSPGGRLALQKSACGVVAVGRFRRHSVALGIWARAALQQAAEHGQRYRTTVDRQKITCLSHRLQRAGKLSANVGQRRPTLSFFSVALWVDE